MKALETLVTAQESLGAKLPWNTPISALTQSSRSVSAGSAYFAVKGSKADGHAFCGDALERGAAVVIVEDPAAFAAFDRAVLVTSTRRALALAAARWFDHPTHQLRLVGVTGTNGKTTTTYLLRQLWTALGIRSGVLGTVAYHLGNDTEPSQLTTPGPLELQFLFDRMIKAQVSHAAMEVSSIALDQSRIYGCEVEVGIFTNLTQDHLDYHGDMEGYYRAKRRFFQEYAMACAVLNADDPAALRLQKEATGAERTLLFGLQAGDFRARSIEFNKRGTTAQVETPAGNVRLRTPLIGKHNLYNALGVLTAAYALGHDLQEAADALAFAVGAPGRLERVEAGARGEPNVFVDYAHSDDALQNVLGCLRDLRAGSPGRIITVFGCGGDRDRGKRPLMGKVASRLSDVTIATSDNPRTEPPGQILDDIETGVDRSRTEFHREENRRHAIHLALTLSGPDDLVLVAGKGHETYQILGTGQIPFDDREVIRDYYRNLKSV